MRTQPCDKLRNTYIVCQGIVYNFAHSCTFISLTNNYLDQQTPVGNCVTGDVRLQDGPNVREGRLEVCINNAWGTVCNVQFGVREAAVVCTQMNFSDEGMHCILLL